MVPPWILLFAGLIAAINVLASTTIVSAAITQSAQVLRVRDQGQTDPWVTLDTPFTASDGTATPSDPNSAPSSTSLVLPLYPLNMTSDDPATASDPNSAPFSTSLGLPPYPLNMTSDNPATASDPNSAPSSTSLVLPPYPLNMTADSPATASDPNSAPFSSSLGLPAFPSNITSDGLATASDPNSAPSSSSLILTAYPPAATSGSNSSPYSSPSILLSDPGLTPPNSATSGSTALGSAGVGSPTSNGIPVALTGTITSIPLGFTATTLSGTSYTENGWITTTDGNHQTTLLPVIVVGGGHGIVFRNFPPIPNVEIALPGFPKFHLPCIRIFGIPIGSCTSSPVSDGPSTENSPADSPANSPTNSEPSSTTTSSDSKSSSSCTVTNTVSNCMVQCVSTTSSSSCASYSTTCSQTSTGCSIQGTTSTVSETAASIAACFFAGTSAILSSPVVGPTSCPLAKRNVPVSQGDLDEFLQEQLGNADLLHSRGTVPFTGGQSSSKRLQFLDRPFSTGVMGLVGCTTVYIISKQGMWEAHFWEIPAFLTATTKEVDGETVIADTMPSSPDFFNSAVIDFIGNGDGPGNPGIIDDLSSGGLFPANIPGSDILGIFIVTPKLKSDSANGVQRYPDQVGAIQDKIKNLLRIHTGDLIPLHTVTYKPLKQQTPNRKFRFGTVLVQYDPQQLSTVTGQTTALVRIYIDGAAFPDMTWDPSPNQKPRKRSIDPIAGQVVQRDLEESDTSDCSPSQQSPLPTTLLTSTTSAKEPGQEASPSVNTSSVSSPSSLLAAPTSPQTITTPPPVPMSYGVIIATTCLQTTTFTEDSTSISQYCGSISDTETSWTSWPVTAIPGTPGIGSWLIKCESLSYSGTSSICAIPSLESDISAIYSALSQLADLNFSSITASYKQ